MELIVLLDGDMVGHLTADRYGHPHFVYEKTWREAEGATPLSLSLPLARASYASDTVTAVLWGLLPDNEHTLQRWASQFHVSPRNPLALLAHVGEDCAGAVQFVRPERMEALLSGSNDDVEWLSETDIAERLRDLRQDNGTGRYARDIGQFSLAGAQPKIALMHEDARGWGIPAGRIPTTHILKPPGGAYDGFAENEHFCLQLSGALGLPTVSSRVMHFDDEVAIVIERYDRIRMKGRWRRVHQEDFCQALGIHPQRKYQNEGGPSPKGMADLLRLHSQQPSKDVEMLFHALVFNWLIAGTDAHAKNYSLLLGAQGHSRLAPLYDISSALPYPKLDRHKIALAMKIGSHYRWWDIRTQDWLTLAKELGLSADTAVLSLRTFANALPELAIQVAQDMEKGGIGHPILGRLLDGVIESSVRCLRRL